MIGNSFGRSFLGECGGSLYGELNLENNIITNLGTPIKNTDAVNKKYVDDIAKNSGAGDMLRSVYDTDGDGVVDNAMALNGLSASEYALKSQLENIDSANKVVVTEINDVKTALDSKAPTSHASSSIMYGVGTSTEYGHLKVADNLTTTTSGTALSANQGKVLKAEIDELVTSIEEKANSDLSNLSDASTALANLGLTATATEINYTDGVTSNIQTQLNNKASSSHIQPASTITSGTFSSTSIKAATGTDYTTARIRNIQASTTDLTAGISALSNGNIYFVYE